MHSTSDLGTRTLTICFVVLVTLVCCARAGAATLTDYRHRVSEAILAIGHLQNASEHDAFEREHFVTTSLARIREDLPTKETVTFNSQSIVVDNSWLDEDLQDYEKAGSTAAQRAEVLARIEQRLRAIDEQLEEILGGKSASNDKDGDKGRLAEILRRSEFNKPADPEGSAVGRLWDRFVRWIARFFRGPKPVARGGSPLIGMLAQILVVGVCVAGIVTLILKLGPRYLNNRRGRKKEKREARIVLGERLEADQTSADLLAQAEALARTGDLRAAIRKAYIALLCELGDRKIVSLAQHKTNRDYLNSLRERTRLYKFMWQLTSQFELHWYGFQPAVENDWKEFRSVYQQALNAGSAG
ncbi:MAG TPA: DUF4129 domain-containing protein [Pyrinomonadaceae bacterium]|nr:DUF4129 domain-containing protein [Pyrinomonadaceae bacterium]